MKQIYQILGKSKYEIIDYNIGKRLYKARFGSVAVKQYFEEKSSEVKLTFFLPESLFIEKEPDEFEDEFKQMGVPEDTEFISIPAIGKYESDSNVKKYVSNVDTITTAILIHFLKSKPNDVYIEVSTGQNIYPICMLEAAKRYLAYRKLEKVLQDEVNVEVYTIFCSPIIKPITDASIEIHKLESKAFFALPKADPHKIILSKEVPKSISNRVIEVNKEHNDVKNKMDSLIKELKIAYNAIKLNIPLVFYTKEIIKMDSDTKSIENDLINFVESALKPIENKENIIRLPLNGVNIANLFYSLALYRSIQEFSKDLNDAEIEQIYKNFQKVYKKDGLGLGANEYFLSRDVTEIKRLASLMLREGEIKNYKTLMTEYRNKQYQQKNTEEIQHQSKEGSHIKRNFFAHSGFVYEYTIIEKKAKGIYAKWDERHLEEIKRWLLDPGKKSK